MLPVLYLDDVLFEERLHSSLISTHLSSHFKQPNSNYIQRNVSMGSNLQFNCLVGVLFEREDDNYNRLECRTLSKQEVPLGPLCWS